MAPFVAGPQPVEESDEKGKIAINGPFTYTPIYLTKEHFENGHHGSVKCEDFSLDNFIKQSGIIRGVVSTDV